MEKALLQWSAVVFSGAGHDRVVLDLLRPRVHKVPVPPPRPPLGPDLWEPRGSPLPTLHRRPHSSRTAEQPPHLHPQRPDMRRIVSWVYGVAELEARALQLARGVA